jgi:Bacteriophage HK97-gp10, putative tail-component
MPFLIEAKVDISKELTRLRELDKATRNKILRPALTAAGRPLVRAMKAKAPNRSGLLYQSLGQKVKAYRNGIIVFLAGPRTGFKDAATGENPTNIAHLAEKGRQAVVALGKAFRMVLKGGKIIFRRTSQAQPARPFMQAAADSTRGEVDRALKDGIQKGIEKQLGF